MYRIGLAAVICLLCACNGNDNKTAESGGEGESAVATTFSGRFTAVSPPYQLTDTSLVSNKDTTSLSAADMATLVPDTTAKKLFGRTSGVKYSPMAKIENKNKESYYVVKGTAGSKKAALVIVLDNSGALGATVPFLVPDEKKETSQVSSIDKSFAITKTVTQRSDDGPAGEGKEVLAYDAKEKKFSLVMTDLLNDNPAVVVNPLDTFPKTNKLAGDYYLNKKNLIAIRDGRHKNQILVYIHTENSGGDCRGELKGEFILTNSTTAVYRQGGDPCVLALTFNANSVTMNEESGCGNYRGLDCPFTGTFTRKKEEKPKETTKKPKQPKRRE